MRTTLTIDDETAKALKNEAHRTGKSFKQIVNETLSAGLAAKLGPPPSRPYRLDPAHLGGTLPGINLTKSRQLADALEDDEIALKLSLRK